MKTLDDLRAEFIQTKKDVFLQRLVLLFAFLVFLTIGPAFAGLTVTNLVGFGATNKIRCYQYQQRNLIPESAALSMLV